MNTFILTENDEELIHRVFGGEKIDRSKVTTINTGGNVMNDLYPTTSGHLVMVFEYGAVFISNPSDYEDGSYQDNIRNAEHVTLASHAPIFYWDEPLEYVDE